MTDLLENGCGDDGDFQVKVSSVLNRQVREYGKIFMFDGREDTCWNSDQARLVTFEFGGLFFLLLSLIQGFVYV